MYINLLKSKTVKGNTFIFQLFSKIIALLYNIFNFNLIIKSVTSAYILCLYIVDKLLY